MATHIRNLARIARRAAGASHFAGFHEAESSLRQTFLSSSSAATPFTTQFLPPFSLSNLRLVSTSNGAEISGLATEAVTTEEKSVADVLDDATPAIEAVAVDDATPAVEAAGVPLSADVAPPVDTSAAAKSEFPVRREGRVFEAGRRREGGGEKGGERTYAVGYTGYNNVMRNLNQPNRAFLLRDVYEDMLLDGVQPSRNTFHFAIISCMRAGRLQDVFYFFNQMKQMGLQPDVILYNAVISACAMCAQPDKAFKVADEMESAGVLPGARTFLALLQACGIAGRVTDALAVVERMKEQNMPLTLYGYAALITAYKNKVPVNEESFLQIFHYLEESRKLLHLPNASDASGAASAAGGADASEDMSPDMTDTGEQETPGGKWRVNGKLVVYRAALRAMLELRNQAGAERVLSMLRDDGFQADTFMQVQIIRSNATSGNAAKAFDGIQELLAANKSVSYELYLIVIEGAIRQFNAKGMAIAKRILSDLFRHGFVFNNTKGSQLLRLASAEKGGDFSCACLLFDHIVATSREPQVEAVAIFLRHLKYRGVSDDDPRVVAAQNLLRQSRGPVLPSSNAAYRKAAKAFS